MSSFAERFTPDEDHPQILSWSAERPFLNEARVDYLIREDGECYREEEGPAYEFSVMAEAEDGGEIGTGHEASWDFILEHRQAVERELRRKLWAICSENFGYFLEEVEENNPDWLEIRDRLDWKDESSLEAQICFTGITLYDLALDEVGLCSFDFEVGWDEDHGLSILMHKDRVIAAAGGSDFCNRGDGLLGHAKVLQEIGFTEGDLRLED